MSASHSVQQLEKTRHEQDIAPKGTAHPHRRRDSFFLHMRPQSYRLGTIRFTNTYYLGFLAVFLIILECATGIILMVYYTPTPDAAYDSIVRLTYEVPFGWLTRDLHRLGGECLIVVIVLHMIRVFLSGKYLGSYRLTWLTGIGLLLCTLMLAFSGYLLPWDQLAYWAVTIGTSMADTIPVLGDTIALLLRGGASFGGDGLLRFYLLHIAGVPLIMSLVFAVHYYRVSRFHHIWQPARDTVKLPGREVEEAQNKIQLFPSLILQELTLALLVLSALILAAAFIYDAPLQSHADPHHTPAITRAPWFFLWLQGALKYGDSFLVGVCLPLALLTALCAMPYLESTSLKPPGKRPVILCIAGCTIAAIIYLSILGHSPTRVGQGQLTGAITTLSSEERKNRLLKVGFDNLIPGVYTAGIRSEEPIPEAFGPFLHEFTETLKQISQEQGVQNLLGLMIVEDWQADLKRTTLRITWQDEKGRPESWETSIFIHRNSIN